MIRIFKVTSLFILASLQLLFLFAVFNHSYNNFLNLIVITTVGLLVSLGILKPTKASNNNSYNNLLLLLFTLSGAIITYILGTELNMGAVIASALVGTLASFIPLLDKNSEQFNELPKAIYCGSFVGMTASFISQGYLFIFLAGIIAGLLYILSKNTFIGVGGKLGTMAFGGVVAAFFILIYSF